MGENFQAVILGTDLNAYNVARAFHEAHGVRSKVFGRAELSPVRHSKICDTQIVADFADDKAMVKSLLDYAKEQEGKDLILFAASENYVFRIFRNYEALSAHYIIPYASPEMGIYYSDKMNFYKECERLGLSYPKAVSVGKDDWKREGLDMTFPLILKPSESSDYFELNFPGKEKAYILENQAEYESAMTAIYEHGYEHDMLLQEFVAGPVTNEYVLNVYSNQEGKVKLLSLGQVIIDHPEADMRGNYLGIVSPPANPAINKLYDNMRDFLEKISFKGLANFDFKWDEQDQTFKVFDFNLRQGRSSFCSVVAGANYAIPVVDDIYGRERELIIGDDDFIWLDCSVDYLHQLFSQVNPDKYQELKGIQNIANTLDYAGDSNILRRRMIKKYLETNDNRLKKNIEESR